MTTRPATRAEEAQERTRRERVMRGVLPFAALAFGILIWDLVVRINDIQPYVLPSPGLVLRTLVSDWPLLWSSLLVTLSVTLQALAARFRRRCRAGDCVQQVACRRIFVLSLRGDPAGDAGDRDRAAAADLSAAAGGGAGLRLDRCVLPGARQHHARAEFGRPESERAVPALRRERVAGAARSETAGGACHTCSAD